MLKKISKRQFKRWLHASLWASGLLFVATASFGGAKAQDVTQGYGTREPVQNGVLVRLNPEATDTIEPLMQENETDLLGVVVSSNQTPVSISNPDQAQVLVASFGQYEVLVSTQNGPIRAGDGIVVSSLKGVGMKSDDIHKVLVGKALENFSDNADAESRASLSNDQTVALGRIKVDISVGRNPSYSGDTIAGVPHFLSRIAHAVTDKPVTALRIYASLAVFFVCLALAGGILYLGIRTGMTSIGRNPMAKKSILRNLFSVALMSIIVVSLGLIAVYLVLRI